MEMDIPIACSLTATELQDRQQAWRKIGAYSRGSQEIAGGLSFAFTSAPGVFESLGELVRLEAECCPWMSFTVKDSAPVITLWVTALGAEGERAVRESFRDLAVTCPD